MARFTVSDLNPIGVLKTWAINLAKGLTFGDNFLAYEWQGELASGEEKRITHNLNLTPTRFLVLYAEGTANIVAGETGANETFFYICNADPGFTFRGKILILP